MKFIYISATVKCNVDQGDIELFRRSMCVCDWEEHDRMRNIWIRTIPTIAWSQIYIDSIKNNVQSAGTLSGIILLDVIVRNLGSVGVDMNGNLIKFSRDKCAINYFPGYDFQGNFG